MYQDTVTLFNRRREEAGDIWYPTVMEGVDLQADEAAVTAKYGYQRGDKALVFIHYDGTPAAPMVGGKAYLPPKAWQASEDPAGAFTFQTGEVFDFFIEGAWPDSGPIAEADWPGGFYGYLVKTRDGVYAVSSAARYSVIPHFEVMGR